MKVGIDKVDNGFIISYDDYDADDRKVERKVIIEEDDDDPIETSEHRSFCRLCCELMDIIGIFNSKHNKERVSIQMEQQDGM